MLDTVPKQRRGPTEGPTAPVTLRVPVELLEEYRQVADQEDRSLNAQIVRAMREWLGGWRTRDERGERT
jgi:hypothetical protein